MKTGRDKIIEMLSKKGIVTVGMSHVIDVENAMLVAESYALSQTDSIRKELAEKENEYKLLQERHDYWYAEYNKQQKQIAELEEKLVITDELRLSAQTEMEMYREKYTCNQHTVVNLQSSLNEAKSENSKLVKELEAIKQNKIIDWELTFKKADEYAYKQVRKDIEENNVQEDNYWSWFKRYLMTYSLSLLSNTKEPRKDVVKEVCTHPKGFLIDYHDSSILCSKCECIIEQFGKAINPPHKL